LQHFGVHFGPSMTRLPNKQSEENQGSREYDSFES